MIEVVSSLTIPCAACGDEITVPRATLKNVVARELIACDSCRKRKLQSFPKDVQKHLESILMHARGKLEYLKGVAKSLGDEEFSSLIDDYEARIIAGQCWDR